MLEKLYTGKAKSYHRFFARGSGKHVNAIVVLSIFFVFVYFILVQDPGFMCQKPNCSSNPHKDILQAISQINKLKMLN